LDIIRSNIISLLEKSLVDSKTNDHQPVEMNKRWSKLKSKDDFVDRKSGVPVDLIRKIGMGITSLPSEIDLHPQVQKIYQARHESIVTGKGIDWATAESLAFATLINEGKTIRLSGQDVERGTFSHRHAIVHDQSKDFKYCPINSISKKKQFHVGNSHLSEFAVLGFELGYSYYDPDHIVIWEAQFGDFVNEATTIIDQFISSQEDKWGVQSGIVLLLPHGMDGQGAEHSSANIRRFLQLLDEDPREIPDYKDEFRAQKTNMRVCNPTTSANYFHLLRRQLRRPFRKPLIIPSPKKLLRFKQANSTIEDFARDEYIKVRLEENQNILKNSSNVKKILACSGQVYYDLINKREELKRNVKYHI